MKQPNTIWKCAECGVVFEALQPCEKGDECIPACCGRGLTQLVENHSDGAGEKHVPVASQADGGRLKVSVGAVAHPMTEAATCLATTSLAGTQLNEPQLPKHTQPSLTTTEPTAPDQTTTKRDLPQLQCPTTP